MPPVRCLLLDCFTSFRNGFSTGVVEAHLTSMACLVIGQLSQTAGLVQAWQEAAKNFTVWCGQVGFCVVWANTSNRMEKVCRPKEQGGEGSCSNIFQPGL